MKLPFCPCSLKVVVLKEIDEIPRDGEIISAHLEVIVRGIQKKRNELYEPILATTTHRRGSYKFGEIINNYRPDNKGTLL